MKIVVSGATKGIGRAILERFVAEGFSASFYARNQEDVKLLEAQLKAQYPNQGIFGFSADAANPESLKAFFEFSDANLGTPDILVNNAGVFFPGEILTEEEGKLELMLQTNLMSAYSSSRHFLKGMIANKSGHIFNMCSIASVIAYPNGGSYSITKFALLGMSKVLREELKPHGIRVTAILPGATYTASWEGVDLPQERFMKSVDIADAVWAAYKLGPTTVLEEMILRPLPGDI